jgi:hypothetical protein
MSGNPLDGDGDGQPGRDVEQFLSGTSQRHDTVSVWARRYTISD